MRARSGPGEAAVFSARMAALPDTAAFVQAFCNRHGIGREDALRLRLLIEELFTNTVEHGHAGGSDADVRITLRLHDGQLAIVYEDRAPPFDPLSRSERRAQSDHGGGFGTLLVGGLASHARYAYEGGANRLWLTLRRRG